ncbi:MULTISPECIES: GyrI-like domain-containing protein [Flavobacteriaceae]|uniref:GyrI-like domain-containing protein n=1 Tax=Flavobacteriaceae TaxID=49546 RepID=UPI00149301F8|nr:MULTISPECIES: GyrI-like domain-containing protein [Allomuricauda]MDC6367171.1 GyrI-like domain-containing protein [Muricauda sp. AC10]
MTPRIEQLKAKKLVGHYIKMSLTENKTGILWRDFLPKIKEIPKRISQDKISMQIYPANYYSAFNPNTEFEKWATVEVEDFENIPDGMSAFNLEGGLYAIFDYKGSSSDTSIFEYIFGEWFPSSGFQIDDRPHFEVLGKNYKNNDPDSEEEIWIPVKANR